MFCLKRITKDLHLNQAHVQDSINNAENIAIRSNMINMDKAIEFETIESFEGDGIVTYMETRSYNTSYKDKQAENNRIKMEVKSKVCIYFPFYSINPHQKYMGGGPIFWIQDYKFKYWVNYAHA